MDDGERVVGNAVRGGCPWLCVICMVADYFLSLCTDPVKREEED
jgi:hypothetical protein